MPALVVDIRRNALDDGPGIRSTVFFKGCVLDCVWCQNPETLSPQRELAHDAQRCVACGDCAAACPHGALRLIPASGSAAARREHDRERCRLDGACVDACPAGAIRFVGREYAVDELVARLMRDEPFYRNSGGGVTFSGGEPTLHLDFVAAVAAALRARGVHTLIETCGLYPADRFEARLLPHLDAVYFDLKLADPERHRASCGVDNRVILANLARLAAVARERVLPRVPLIPALTDTDDNLAAIARILGDLGFPRVALLPYNPLWVQKRAELGLPFRYRHDRFMEPAELARCRAVMAGAGLELA